jgi:hypothetical protein
MIAAPLIHCIAQVRLWNQSEDRVKIVYHPEFLSSTSAILPLEYNEVLQTIKSRTRTRTHVVVILIRCISLFVAVIWASSLHTTSHGAIPLQRYVHCACWSLSLSLSDTLTAG